MKREAVSGRLIEQKSKSEKQRDKTNIVVACFLNLWHFSRATIVIILPY